MQQPGISDRSFQYGDGVFTTIRVARGQLLLWPYHWLRLNASLQRLGMAAVDEVWLKHQAEQQISAPEQVLKIVISRGQGGRGYSPAGFTQSQCYCSVSPLPDYQSLQQQGLHLDVATLQLGIQPLLAGIKHTSRLETVLLKAEVERSQADDLVACDSTGLVTELSAANLFFYQDGRWHTPRLHQAGVAGVTRQWLLDYLQITPGCYSLAQLQQAEAMLACNALMGLVPVRQLAGLRLDVAPVRPLQQAYVDFINQQHNKALSADYFRRDLLPAARLVSMDVK